MLAALKYLFGKVAGHQRRMDAINQSEANDRMGQGEAGNNSRSTCTENGLSGCRFVRASPYISWGQVSALFYRSCLLIRWRSLNKRL